jgi:hypothetical protein
MSQNIATSLSHTYSSAAMARRRLINGALEGFLGNLVSRYSDLNGYWLLGFLATKRASLEIDLRGGTQEPHRTSPEDCFVELARRKFDEQLDRWRVPVAWVAGARLDVIWSKDVTSGFVAGTRQDGYEATFAASVKTDLGRTMARAKHIFVAPHNPRLESKSARAA